MAYDPGSTIEDIISNVLGFALGAPGGQGAIDRTVTPAVVGQPGSAAWLVVTGQGEQPTVGYSTGQTAGKLTFWRQVDADRNQYIEIQLAGTPSINTLDNGTPGSGNLVLTRDAWQAFHAQVPGLMGEGKVLDPVSIDQTRMWFSAAANYMGLKIDEMNRTLENLDRDTESFRGSASETFVQRVANAMAKVEGAREKAQAWDRRFENAYHGARIFRDQVTRELTELGTRYEGALLNPINFVIKLLNSARVESVAAPAGSVPAQNVMLTIPELGASGGPYDVFAGGSWSALDAAIRAKWAAEVANAFPATKVAAPQLVIDFGDGAAALRGQPTPAELEVTSTDPGPNASNTANVPPPGGGPSGDSTSGNPGGLGDPTPSTTFFNAEAGPDGGPNADTNTFTNNAVGPDGNSGGDQNLPDGGLNERVAANTFLAGGDNATVDTGTNGGANNLPTGSDGGPGGAGAEGGGQGGTVVSPALLLAANTTGPGADPGQGASGGGGVGGFGTSLGGMSPSQLQQLQMSGDLDQFLLTDEMRDLLRESGMPADGAVTLGELGTNQLTVLQDGGLLDGLTVGEGSTVNSDSGFSTTSVLAGAPGAAGDESTDGSDGFLNGSFSDLQDDSTDADAALRSAQETSGDFTGTGTVLTSANTLGTGDAFAFGITDLGTMSPAQLDQLLDSGALDGIAFTDQMGTLLGAFGAGADGAGSLGDLTLDQLLTLQDSGLLDGLSAPGAGPGADEGSSLFSASTMELTSTEDAFAPSPPQDLGELSTGQIGTLQDSGLLDGIAITDAQLDELRQDGLLGSGDSGVEVLGDLNPAQLQDLQLSGLLDDLPLTPSQLNELGIDPLGTGSGSGLVPEGLGADLPSSQFPTSMDALDVGSGSGLGGPTGGGTPIGNVSQSGATNLGSGSGFSVKAFEPGGAMAGAPHAGTLNVPSFAASSPEGMGTGSVGSENTPSGRSSGMTPPMMPMMPGAASNGAKDRRRNRNLQVVDVDDVWGAEPDCGPAVIGRPDRVAGQPTEVTLRPEQDVDTEFGQVPGRARRPETRR